MEKIYRVSYILNGVTERTDDFNAEGMDNGFNVSHMVDNSTESAIKAIREQFSGVWGFDPNGIEIKSIITGHYEYQMPTNPSIARLPFFKGNKVFIAD